MFTKEEYRKLNHDIDTHRTEIDNHLMQLFNDILNNKDKVVKVQK